MHRFTLKRTLKLAVVVIILLIGVGTVFAQSDVTVLTLNDLRLRTGPGTKFDVVATVPANTTLNADARSAASDWVRVQFQGQSGWVYAAQLRIKGNFAALPVADANSTPLPAIQGPTPTPGPPPDGTIADLHLIGSTDRVTYYRLLYYSDGLKVTGFYAEPKSPGTYPAIIYNRGGNRNVGALTGIELVPFAECGFVTVATQYRGVLGGEGQEEFGGADVHDVLNLILLLKSRGNVDPARIGIFGTSRGGMMTYLALKAEAQSGASDLKVAVTVSGISDLFMWDKEHPELTRGLYSELIGATPLTNSAPFRDRSATYWPNLIRVPLLIEHGSADTTVSIAQSEKLYNLLKARGSAVKLITYAGDGHGLPNSEAGLPEAMKWFQKYIGKPGESFDFGAHQNNIAQGYGLFRGS